MNVGFIGLGSMGIEMARNLLNAGHALRVWNRSSEKAASLASAGASVADSPVDLATCDVVFAMLANDAATRETIVTSGLLARLEKKTTFVNCATISIALARELTDVFATAGVPYVAAPVLGRPDAAAAAKLNVIVAGNTEDIARIQPLLDVIGTRTWPVGSEPYLANVTKIGANFLIASAVESLGEAFAIASGNGVDPHALYDIVTNTIFAAPVYKNYGAQILAKRFEPGFALELGLKDVALANSAAESANANVPVAAALACVFQAAVDAGDGMQDWTAVTKQTSARARAAFDRGATSLA